MPNQQPFTTPEQTTGAGLRIRWQLGPKSAGVNGATPYDVIRAAYDRLAFFQAGPVPCRENQEAMTCLLEAMAALDARTADRFRRGVIGQPRP